MIVEFGLIFVRVYGAGIFLLSLNVLSRLAFDFTHERVFQGFKSVLFIPFWPLAIFSPSGRDAIFNRINKL